jgi:hypothetical protein
MAGKPRPKPKADPEVAAEIETSELEVKDDLKFRGSENEVREVTDPSEVSDLIGKPIQGQDEPQFDIPAFVKELVRNFVSQEVAELQQRITDLEMLVGQPQGAVQFGIDPSGSDPDAGHVVTASVPWYEPKG